MSWKKIVCAVDFSEGARAALEEAADLARRTGAQLTLVHVYEPAPPLAGDLAAWPADVLEETAYELGRVLETWKVDAERLAEMPVRALLLTGPPASEIVRCARDGGFDLIVMGTHGRGGLARVVLGSVAERVVRQAHCPVLVARAPLARAA